MGAVQYADQGQKKRASESHDSTFVLVMWCKQTTWECYVLFQLTPSLHSWNKSKGASSSSDLDFAFRAEQLEFRKHEIYFAYSAFRNLVLTGERGDLRTIDESPLDWESWTGDWVQCDEGVSLVGHSFGGATVVSWRRSFPFISPSLTWHY